MSPHLRRWLFAGFLAADALGYLAMSVIAGMALASSAAVTVTTIIPRLQQWHSDAIVYGLTDSLYGKAATAGSSFTPTTDVLGNPNCTGGTPAGGVSAWCHEVDFLTEGTAGRDTFDAFYYANGSVTHYTYSTPNGAGKPSGVSAAGGVLPVSTFECRPVKSSQFATDSWTSSVLGSLASVAVSDINEQTRYTGIVKSNAAVVCDVGDTTSTLPVVLTSLELPSQLTLDTGTYTPTPQPSVAPLGGGALTFHWPAAAAQTFQVEEANYHDAFFVEQDTCGGIDSVTPQYVNGSPNYTPGSMATGNWKFPNPNPTGYVTNPATFTANIPTGAGVCDFGLYDVYANRGGSPPAVESIDVMGWLTETSPYDGSIATSLTGPLDIPQVYAGKSTLESAGNSVHFSVSKTYDGSILSPAVALDSTCSQLLSPSVGSQSLSGSGPTAFASAVVTLTMTTTTAVKRVCGGTVGDQYGEPVAKFALTIDPPTCVGLQTPDPVSGQCGGSVSLSKYFEGGYKLICTAQSHTSCLGYYTDGTQIKNMSNDGTAYDVTTYFGGYQMTLTGPTSYIDLRYTFIGLAQAESGTGIIQGSSGYSTSYPPSQLYTNCNTANFICPSDAMSLDYLTSATWLQALGADAQADAWQCNAQVTSGTPYSGSFGTDSSGNAEYCNSNVTNGLSPASSGPPSRFLTEWYALLGTPSAFSSSYLTPVAATRTQDPTSGLVTVDEYVQAPAGTYYLFLHGWPAVAFQYIGGSAGMLEEVLNGQYTIGGGYPYYTDMSIGYTNWSGLSAQIVQSPPPAPPTPTPNPCAIPMAWKTNPSCPVPNPPTNPSGPRGGTGPIQQ